MKLSHSEALIRLWVSVINHQFKGFRTLRVCQVMKVWKWRNWTFARLLRVSRVAARLHLISKVYILTSWFSPAASTSHLITVSFIIRLAVGSRGPGARGLVCRWWKKNKQTKKTNQPSHKMNFNVGVRIRRDLRILFEYKDASAALRGWSVVLFPH